MKIILLTGIIFTVVQTMFASKHGKPHSSGPCIDRSVLKKYNNFTKNHIIQTEDSLNSAVEWERYLREQKLWCRTWKQSFLPANKKAEVLKICSPSGDHVDGNLCSSRKLMLVYDVLSFKCPPKHEARKQNFNSYIRVKKKERFVIVACNKVENECRPVHFEGNENPERTNKPCIKPQRQPTKQSKGLIRSRISKKGRQLRTRAGATRQRDRLRKNVDSRYVCRRVVRQRAAKSRLGLI